jgi:cysteine-rich repeat protein
MLLRFTVLGLAAFALLLGCDGTPATDDDAGPPPPPMDAGDGCPTANRCNAVGALCVGDAVVTCAEDAVGCLVETREECPVICDAASATCVDPCEGVADRCETEGRTCDGETLVACEDDGGGCLVETRTACDARDGGFCDAEAGACDGPFDVCATVENPCDAVGASCTGEIAVVCAPDAFGCLVETQTDCFFGGGSCRDGGCRTTAACAGGDRCFSEGVTCDGPELTVCAPDVFGCLRETRTDCADLPEGAFGICDLGVGRCRTVLTDPCPAVPACEVGTTCSDVITVARCERDTLGCPTLAEESCAASGNACVGGRCLPSQCPAVQDTLDCESGVLPLDTATGTDLLDRYSCLEGAEANELVYAFTAPEDLAVTFTSAVAATGEEYALVVLNADSSSEDCSRGTPCLGQSTEGSVEVELRAGARVWVAVDGAAGTAGTTAVDLGVSCAVAVCGDGAIGAFEACDDGNTDPGDGCSNLCAVEPSFECSGEPSVCTGLCGNGTVDVAFESCDDRNSTAGDGCSDCALELPTGITPLVLEGESATTDPTWVRPSAGCAPGTASVNYDAFFVVNPSATALDLALIADHTSTRAVHVFDETWDPTAPTTGCLDGTEGTAVANTLRVPVPAGARRVIVVSRTTTTGAVGDYSVTIAPAYDLSLTATSDTVLRGNVTGGSRFDDSCPAGEALVGLDGEVSGWIRRLSAVCGRYFATTLDGVAYVPFRAPGASLPFRGRLRGTLTSVRCSGASVVSGFDSRTGGLVDRIGLLCAPLQLAGSPGAFTVTLGTPTPAPPLGGGGGSAQPRTECPAGDVAEGAIIRAGDSVDAFGLSCATPSFD